MVNREEGLYLDLLHNIMSNGQTVMDRTGVGTSSLFDANLKFDLTKGFPLITTKKIHWKSVIHELLWFISGSTNIKYLQDNGVKIWDSWADENGELGPVYGSQWRKWKSYGLNSIDQLADLIHGLKTNPASRRHIVSAWNVADIPDMKLPPCHMMFQCYVRKGFLDLKLYQRSADAFLGVPFNIASYALLTHMLAQVCGLKPGILTMNFGDIHIYSNHEDQVQEQMNREPRPFPTIKLDESIMNIDDFRFEHITLENYDPHPAIKGDVAV